MSTAPFGLFDPADGESYPPLLKILREVREYMGCVAVIGFNLLDDPDRLFRVAEASVLTGYKPETLRHWAASGCIALLWFEAIAEYRLTAATLRQIRDGGAGPEGRHQPTFVDAPPDVPARIRKIKRHADGAEGPMALDGKKLNISDECLERLETWLLAHVRSALDDKEFVGGLLYIVNEEVKEALERGRREAVARMTQPQPQYEDSRDHKPTTVVRTVLALADGISRFSKEVRAAHDRFLGHHDHIRYRDELGDVHRGFATELATLIGREAERIGPATRMIRTATATSTATSARGNIPSPSQAVVAVDCPGTGGTMRMASGMRPRFDKVGVAIDEHDGRNISRTGAVGTGRLSNESGWTSHFNQETLT